MATAGATSTTSITETIYGEWISPVMQSYARHYNNPTQFFASWQPTNGSATISVPRPITDAGVPSLTEGGAATDTEYDAVEATALTALEFETEQDSSFNVNEYGIERKISYTSMEDTTAEGLMETILGMSAVIIQTAKNDDGCALFPSFTNLTGTTTADLTIANIDDALYALSDRGIMGTLVGVLHGQQVRDFSNAIQASSTSQATYAGAAETTMGYSADAQQGRNVAGFAFTYKGVSFYKQNLCDTQNTGADVCGAIFVRGDEEANRPMAALGQAAKRGYTIESFRSISDRIVQFVSTERWGCGITLNTAGQEVTTDAP